MPSINTSIPDASNAGLARRESDPSTRPSRYASAAVPVSAESAPTGPALTPPNESEQESPANRDDDRLAASENKSREPAPFMADPFALPANSKNESSARHERNSAQTELPPLERPDSARPSAPAVVENQGQGRPGAPQFEGLQSPQLAIQKLAPQEVQVGKPTGFRTVIRNAGQIPAVDVEVHDMVPRGTRLLGTAPQATVDERGELIWTLGTLAPGEERHVEMQLMPTDEGEMGSVATVFFRTDASARAVVTRPKLVVETTGPSRVMIGNQAVLKITVSNPGTGMATGVILEEHIPAGMQHPAGSELEYEVGNLKPGETRTLELPLTANRPGVVSNMLSARGEGNLTAEHKFDFEVIAPQLNVEVEGPKRRFLERQATYQLSVANPGTASAKQVELVANLPAGLDFVSANNAGYYEESTRTVRWRLEELPANETGTVELVTMPTEAGRHAIRLCGTAENGLKVEKEQPVMVEGIAAILFQVADMADPIELGGKTTYEIRVTNQGSKAASNVQLAVIFPPELQPTEAEGPTRHRLEGNRVVFDGMALLPPKGETTYRVRAKSLRAGDLRVSFQLQTDDMQTPVTKEESTRVFADE